VARSAVVSLEDLKDRIARNLSERRVEEAAGELGTLSIALRKDVVRVFRAHWTGFQIAYPHNTIVLRLDLKDGSLWCEGYISLVQPSWVLSFRKKPPSARGSGGPRPDDKFTHPEHVEEALSDRKRMIEEGRVADEELIRMEDYDDPIEAVDSFFNYTSFYVLKAIDASWDQVGYSIDPSVGWDQDAQRMASVPIDAAIDEGLKKSDIIWLTPNTSPNPVPCWFIYKDGKGYVLSGERQQVIPGAERVRDAHVVCRWKGRDARLIEFDAAVRHINARNPAEFTEIAELMLNKRQSVTGDHEEYLQRWMRECVILELTPRV
jgi:hypothetical protein